MTENRVEINGLDFIDVIKLIDRRNRRYLAIMLDDIESVVEDPEEYTLVRKIILDNMNEYTRSILRGIFGGDNIEGLLVY